LSAPPFSHVVIQCTSGRRQPPCITSGKVAGDPRRYVCCAAQTHEGPRETGVAEAFVTSACRDRRSSRSAATVPGVDTKDLGAPRSCLMGPATTGSTQVLSAGSGHGPTHNRAASRGALYLGDCRLRRGGPCARRIRLHAVDDQSDEAAGHP
jgi:hypothetical protein